MSSPVQNNVTGQISKLVPKQKCDSKSREVCHQVPKEVYNSVPRKKCTQVTTETKNGIYEDVELLDIKKYVENKG